MSPVHVHSKLTWPWDKRPHHEYPMWWSRWKRNGTRWTSSLIVSAWSVEAAIPKMSSPSRKKCFFSISHGSWKRRFLIRWNPLLWRMFHLRRMSRACVCASFHRMNSPLDFFISSNTHRFVHGNHFVLSWMRINRIWSMISSVLGWPRFLSSLWTLVLDRSVSIIPLPDCFSNPVILKRCNDFISIIRVMEHWFSVKWRRPMWQKCATDSHRPGRWAWANSKWTECICSTKMDDFVRPFLCAVNAFPNWNKLDHRDFHSIEPSSFRWCLYIPSSINMQIGSASRRGSIQVEVSIRRSLRTDHVWREQDRHWSMTRRHHMVDHHESLRRPCSDRTRDWIWTDHNGNIDTWLRNHLVSNVSQLSLVDCLVQPRLETRFHPICRVNLTSSGRWHRIFPEEYSWTTFQFAMHSRTPPNHEYVRHRRWSWKSQEWWCNSDWCPNRSDRCRRRRYIYVEVTRRRAVSSDRSAMCCPRGERNSW